MKHILWPTFSNLPIIIFRIGFYFANIFIFIWPVFLIFASKKILKKVSSPKNLLATAGIFIVFLTAAILVKNYFPGNAATILPIKKTFAPNYSYFLAIIPYPIIRTIWLVNAVLALAVMSLSFVLAAGSFFRFARKIKDWQSTVYFLIFSFILMFIWILILPFVWAEYSVALLPFVLIGLALISRKLPINRQIAPVVIFFLIIPSFLNAKITHEVLGNIWNKAEKLVQSGVSPAVIDTGEYAWYPWWYYEETFVTALARAGGDKNKLEKLQTWDFPKTEDYKYKLNF